MMIPDYALISEIKLYSYGIHQAGILAKKIVLCFKTFSEQLSSQDHYDFGMRAVKSVLLFSKILRSNNPEMDEN